MRKIHYDGVVSAENWREGSVCVFAKLSSDKRFQDTFATRREVRDSIQLNFNWMFNRIFNRVRDTLSD